MGSSGRFEELSLKGPQLTSRLVESMVQSSSSVVSKPSYISPVGIGAVVSTIKPSPKIVSETLPALSIAKALA